MLMESQQKAITLLDAVTTTATGEKQKPLVVNRTFQLIGNTSAGVGAASVKVQVSNDGTNWVDLATLSLTLGTTVTSDSTSSAAPWLYVRGKVDSISGTGANVSLFMGV